GEFGQGVIDPGAPVGERLIEHVCSRKATIGRLRKLLQMQRPSDIPDRIQVKHGTQDLDKLDPWIVGEAYQAGDPLTEEVLNDSADRLGVCIANVITLLAIPTVLLGGGLAEVGGQKYADRVTGALHANLYPASHAERVRVKLTELQGDAGLIGAADLARTKAMA
ncbi:MAG: ROK family protein, partial [Planctomycetota bacterium]